VSDVEKPAVEKPAVERRFAPPSMIHVANPILRRLLTSPLHRPMSKGLMVLHVTGRRSGRVYDIVVGRHGIDGQLVAHTGGAWRANLRGGAALTVTLDGRERKAYAVLEEDPDRVAETYLTLLKQIGYERAIRIGLAVNVDRPPTLAEVREAVVDDGFATIRLTD
jgi:hypothetical protein